MVHKSLAACLSTASAMGPITNALAMEAAAMVLVAALDASKAGLFVLGTLLGTSADTPLKRSARETIAVDNFAMVERCF